MWTVRASETALSMLTLSTCDGMLPTPPKPPEPQLDPVAWPQAAADAARNSQLQAALNAVFSTNRASRVQATQKIIADADLVSDLLPMALQRAWLIESGAASGAGSNDARSRVIQTLALAQAATPVTQQWNALAIYRLLDSVKDNGALAETESAALRKILLASKGKKPLVYLQIADEKQRAAAVKLQARLNKLGFDAPGVEYVGDKAPDQPELRLRGRSDQALARWLAQTQVKSAGLAATAVVGLSKAEAAVDTYELWFAKESGGGALKVGTRFRDCADDTCPWMVVIPAGKFQMGSMLVDGGSESNERPLHDVIINRSLAVKQSQSSLIVV